MSFQQIALAPAVLYGTGSSNVMKIVLMLEELGQAYEFKHISIWRGEQYADPVRLLNPNNKVPILVESGVGNTEPTVVFESAAILIYLAERARRFLPEEGVARYDVLQWVMVQVSGMGPAFGQHIHFTRFEPNASVYAQERHTGESGRLIDVFENRLKGRKYLCADQFTIADIAAYPWLCRLTELKLPDDKPNISQWCARIAERPAAVKMQSLAATLRKETAVMRAAATADDLDRLFVRKRK